MFYYATVLCSIAASFCKAFSIFGNTVCINAVLVRCYQFRHLGIIRTATTTNNRKYYGIIFQCINFQDIFNGLFNIFDSLVINRLHDNWVKIK